MQFGVIVSVVGWLAQVEGLRWMTWTAPVLQLFVPLTMLFLRSYLRRNFSWIPKITQIYGGHELDWLALEIAKADSWELGGFD